MTPDEALEHPDFFDFVYHAEQEARKVCGSFNLDDGEAATRLFEEFLESGEGRPSKWLVARLASYFAVVDSRPDWHRREPEWPFCDGKPMTFVLQHLIPPNNVSETEVYLFMGRRPLELDGEVIGFEVEHRVIDINPDLPA